MNHSPFEVEVATLPGQQSHGGTQFPLVLEHPGAQADLSAALSWLESRRHELDRQVESHGAILFRGFPVATDEDFDAFVAALGYPNFPYEQSLSNAVRVNRTERVFTANEAPADVPIFLHHELAQTPIFPGKLFFFCERPADSGGATPICRSDLLLERLAQAAPQFIRDCETKGLKYTNVMPPEADLASGMGRCWQSTLSVMTPNQAETRLRDLGYTWQWLDDGALLATTPVLPAVRTLPSGRKAFFNQLIAATRGWRDRHNDPNRSLTFGDGGPLDRDGVLLAAQIAEELSFDIPWRAGDVALVDNLLTMHGRRTFAGQRKVLASLVAAESHETL